MKTVIGRKILKEASKSIDKHYKEAVEIARKFKAAKKDDWNKPEYMELMEKFLKIR